jgi:hypothetical protein
MQCVVFVSGVDQQRYRFEGIAELQCLRWALAQRYPWLEQAFAHVYSDVLSTPLPDPYGGLRYAEIGSRRGRLDALTTRSLLDKYLAQCRGALLYAPDDIPQPVDLAVMLSDQQNVVSAYLMSQFDQATQQLLASSVHLAQPASTDYAAIYQYNTTITNLRTVLSTALNAIIEGGQLYRQDRFSSVSLGTLVTTMLLPSNPQGEELMWLNRLLLDAAYGTKLAGTKIQPTATADGKLTPLKREWTQLHAGDRDWLHARWLDAARVERLLGTDLSRTRLREGDLIGKSRQEMAQLVLAQTGAVLPVVEDDGRFSRILDRQGLLETLARDQVP